jgi:hypothetical protein
VLRRTFGPKEAEEDGENCSSLNIVDIIISWRMHWAGHVACIGETVSAYSLSRHIRRNLN